MWRGSGGGGAVGGVVLVVVGGGGGVALLIEILYRVSMGIVNFVGRERKTARVSG